jgi:hypothetical protein
MAWTTPDWLRRRAGDLLTAAQFNTHVRDGVSAVSGNYAELQDRWNDTFTGTPTHEHTFSGTTAAPSSWCPETTTGGTTSGTGPYDAHPPYAPYIAPAPIIPSQFVPPVWFEGEQEAVPPPRRARRPRKPRASFAPPPGKRRAISLDGVPTGGA